MEILYTIRQYLRNVMFLYPLIICLNLLAYFSDNFLSQQWGCIISYERYLVPYRITLLSISCTLIFIALLKPGSNLSQKLVSGEFILTLLVIFFIKGGYAVGIVGVPTNVFYFDLAGIFLRSLLVCQLFELNYFTEKKYYELIIFGISFLLITIKSMFYSLPLIDLS